MNAKQLEIVNTIIEQSQQKTIDLAVTYGYPLAREIKANIAYQIEVDGDDPWQADLTAWEHAEDAAILHLIIELKKLEN